MKKWYFLVPLFLQKLFWSPTMILLKVCGHLEIKGRENLRGLKTNVIFASNHTSELDPILLTACVPFFSRFSPMFYTSRERSFYDNVGWRQHFYGGALFKAWGAYPVSVGLRDYEKSMVNHLNIVRDGGNLCIFPEGGIPKDGIIRQAKGGVAYLSHITGKPVVPVNLSGVFHLGAKDFFLGRGKLVVTFGQPIYITAPVGVVLSPDQCKAWAQTIMDKIKSLRQEAPVVQRVPVPVPVSLKAGV